MMIKAIINIIQIAPVFTINVVESFNFKDNVMSKLFSIIYVTNKKVIIQIK